MGKLTLVFLFFITFNSYSCQLDVRLENYSTGSHKNDESNWFAIDIDLTKALLDEVGCNYNIVETPWARALLMLASGEIDLLLNVSKTQEREEVYYFLGPINNEEIIFATYKHLNYNLTKIEDIFKLDKPIAIQREAYYGDAMQRLINDDMYKELFVVVANNKTKLRLLKRGRISGFLEAKRYIIHGIENNVNYKGLWYPNLVIYKNPTYFALSKESINKALKKRLFNGFEHLVAQGKIKEITQKHQN